MIWHPSLTAPHIELPDINPLREMQRNAPCWCGSARKWKVCHRIRESLPPMPDYEIAQITEKVLTEGRCMHPLATSDCGNKIIAAHTVQKKAGLKAIAENGHVLATKQKIQSLFKSGGAYAPERVGVNRASTFQGFCDKHDAEFFRPVETQAWLASKQSAFLLSFRAVAYEVYTKDAALKLNRVHREWDRGRPFEYQSQWQTFLFAMETGLKLGARDGRQWMRLYNGTYSVADYSAYRFACLEFQPVLPIVACGGLHVEADFNGKLLQRLARHTQNYEHLTINITAVEDRSIAVFGWVGSIDGPAAQLTRSFLEVPDCRKSHALIRLVFENLENTFLRESWWNDLPAATRAIATKRIHSGLPSTDFVRQRDALMEDGIDYFAAEVTRSTGLQF